MLGILVSDEWHGFFGTAASVFGASVVLDGDSVVNSSFSCAGVGDDDDDEDKDDDESKFGGISWKWDEGVSSGWIWVKIEVFPRPGEYKWPF